MARGVVGFNAISVEVVGSPRAPTDLTHLEISPLIAPSSSVSLVVVVAFLVGASAVAFRQGRPQQFLADYLDQSPQAIDDPLVEADDEVLDGDECLTDAERVEQLLFDRGGRMRQTAIVEGTEWSKSKVSVLLTEMEAEDRIRKLRVGRENLVSLPGFEPDAVRRRDTD